MSEVKAEAGQVQPVSDPHNDHIAASIAARARANGGYKGSGLTIHQKITAIKAGLEVEKTGYDTQNDYHYFKADDIARDVHRAMTEYGVVHQSSIEQLDIDNYWDKQGRNRPRVTAIIKVSFISAEDGGYLDTQVVATGSDIGGDKATRKLMVQAFKEAAIDVFGITEGMKSMDSDTYAEAEPDVAKEEVPDASTEIKLDSKKLGERITELIESTEEAYAHIDGPMVMAVGRRVAKEVLGELPTDRVWKKDARVLDPTIKALEKGEVE